MVKQMADTKLFSRFLKKDKNPMSHEVEKNVKGKEDYLRFLLDRMKKGKERNDPSEVFDGATNFVDLMNRIRGEKLDGQIDKSLWKNATRIEKQMTPEFLSEITKKEMNNRFERFQKTKDDFEEGLKSGPRKFRNFLSMKNAHSLLQFSYAGAVKMIENGRELSFDPKTMQAYGEANGYMDPEFVRIGDFCSQVDFIQLYVDDGKEREESKKLRFNVIASVHFLKQDFPAIEAITTKGGRFKVDQEYLRRAKEFIEKFEKESDEFFQQSK